MSENRICGLLGIRYPIIQAPMNWVSGAQLVAAVSNAGGLGTLGPNAGSKDITADVEETGERFRPDMPSSSVPVRIRTFSEVELGYSRQDAIEEASRCLRCDLQDSMF